MRKKLSLLLGSVLFINSCTILTNNTKSNSLSQPPRPIAIQTQTPVINQTPLLAGNEIKANIGNEKLNKPGGIAFNNGKIYVTNWDKGGTITNQFSEGEVKIFDK